MAPKNKASSRKRKPKGSSRSRKLKKEKTRSDQGAYDFSEWLPLLSHFAQTVSRGTGEKKKKKTTGVAEKIRSDQGAFDFSEWLPPLSHFAPTVSREKKTEQAEKKKKGKKKGKKKKKKTGTSLACSSIGKQKCAPSNLSIIERMNLLRKVAELEEKDPDNSELVCLPMPDLFDDYDFDEEYVIDD